MWKTGKSETRQRIKRKTYNRFIIIIIIAVIIEAVLDLVDWIGCSEFIYFVSYNCAFANSHTLKYIRMHTSTFNVCLIPQPHRGPSHSIKFHTYRQLSPSGFTYNNILNTKRSSHHHSQCYWHFTNIFIRQQQQLSELRCFTRRRSAMVHLYECKKHTQYEIQINKILRRRFWCMRVCILFTSQPFHISFGIRQILRTCVCVSVDVCVCVHEINIKHIKAFI